MMQLLTSFLIVVSAMASANGAEQKLSVSTTAPKQVAPFQIVPISLTLRNEDTRTAALHGQYNGRRTRVRILDSETGKLHYEGMVEVSRLSHTQEEPPPRKLLPGRRYEYSILLRCRWTPDSPLTAMFERVGQFRIQVEVPLHYSFEGVEEFVSAKSDWIEVTVAKPPRKEARALDALLKMPQRGWLFEPQESTVVGTKAERQNWEASLAKFVKNHSNSYWAPYAHVALAHLYESRAYENIGDPEMKAKWMEKMDRSVKLGLGTTKSLSSGAARELLLSRESNARRVEPQMAAPKPLLDPLTAAYRELEAEFYDVKSLAANRTPWAIELRRKTQEFFDLGIVGQMPGVEARRHVGELTKEYVRKHDKRLSKSEWNRRYKIYAEQQKAQQARQRAEQMRDAPENARILREAIEKRRREQAKPK